MFELIPVGKYRNESFGQLARSLDALFRSGMPAVPTKQLRSVAFGTDIRETEQGYVIEAELPGFRKEEIEIDYSSPYLTIRAMRRSEDESDGDAAKRYIRRERLEGEYVRRFYIKDVGEQGIRASMKDGVLSLHVQKKTPTPAQRIEIQDGA
ncbi:Hsp20/alpha crystallin family protein [Paenibacillus hodogayensis]|uniref:Hsp20/alpha crystallin family protein n=1 Tax=Paenibacillus hodogayensis TaxID=279208 RepID=A0ABV5VXT2_9BACL